MRKTVYMTCQRCLIITERTNNNQKYCPVCKEIRADEQGKQPIEKPCQYPNCAHIVLWDGVGRPRKYCDRCSKRAVSDNSAAYWRRNHPQTAKETAPMPLTDKQIKCEQKREALKAEYAAYLSRQEGRI